MAALQVRGGSFRILFRYNGKQHTFTIGSVSQEEAEAKAAQVNYLLMRLKQRLLVVPEGIDIITFLQHDGKPLDGSRALPTSPRKVITLLHLKDRYLETHGNGTLEANSLSTCKLHLNHFCRVLGNALPLGDLSVIRLQEYVNRRSKEGVTPVTIRKEIATLRAAWNWGEVCDLTRERFPNKGIRYPKSDEKPPFMTYEEISRQLEGGGDPENLWDALYLQTDELNQLLGYVKEKDSYSWVYPMFCFAGHTGARRSEIIRALVADVDFSANVVTIREKKRSRGERTSRRVPLTPFLREVLQKWIKNHPGGLYLFCHTGEVARSKKRSPTTGHKGEKKRASSLKGRRATVKKRELPPPEVLTRNEVHHHFKWVLKDSKWEVIRGLHCLRHSFISACASKGVDQRLVETWAGHMSTEMSRRYAHLWPSIQQKAIKHVFE